MARLKPLARRALARFDIGIYRPSRARAGDGAFDLSFLPETEQIIDIGVAQGTPWLYEAFPQASLLLLDPLPEHPLVGQALVGRAYSYAQVACGREVGSVTMYEDLDSMGRSSILPRTDLTETGSRKRPVEVDVRPLDDVAREHLDLARPVGLKVDTEGYELEVFAGARETLAAAAFVICEVSVKRRFENSYRFEELIRFFDDAGFGVEEVVSAERGPGGRVLFVDLAFVPRR